MSIKSDNRHLYLKVIDRLKQDIENGLYHEKEKLPSEFELAKRMGVSRVTLREALRILEEENVITRRHGVGTFVNSKPLFSSGIEQLNSVTNMIINAGMKPGTITININTQEPSEEDIRRLLCSIDENIVVSERVRTANGDPVVYTIDKHLEKILPESEIHGIDSIFAALESALAMKISYAVSYIEPLGFHEKISPLLECEPETALLVLKQIHFDETDQSCSLFC